MCKLNSRETVCEKCYQEVSIGPDGLLEEHEQYIWRGHEAISTTERCPQSGKSEEENIRGW